MKEHMIEAVKRKRALIEQHEEDSEGEHAGGQSSHASDDELAPARGSESDALLGKPGGKNSAKDAESSSDSENETQLGEECGFNKEMGHESAPQNSKNLFQDPKKDTHDPVDLNRHRNMAGDGSNSKYDKMGVDEHKPVRLQSSKLAGKNAMEGESLKDKERNLVKSKMDISSDKASSGIDAGKDAAEGGNDHQQQQGFAAVKSKMNMSGRPGVQDQDAEGVGDKGRAGLYADDNSDEGDGDEEGRSMKPKMSGLKGARAKLDGYLSKLRK